MTARPIDPYAAHVPRNSRLATCLYVPVAARDLNAIEKFVGRIVVQLTPRTPGMAVVVDSHQPDEPDLRLAIWKLPEAKALHFPKQVWVHVDYKAYRSAYSRAFPDADLTGLVLDHVMNRQVARLKGFSHVRLVPISRPPNSSHGGLSEKWGIEYHSRPRVREINKASKAVVQYADLAEIVKMLNMKGGGSLMENVNEAQRLVEVPLEARTEPQGGSAMTHS